MIPAGLVLLVCLAGTPGPSLDGQASGWLVGSWTGTATGQGGLRYIPTLSLGTGSGQNPGLDAELAANGRVSAEVRPESSETSARVKPYRLWLRLSGARYEARAGLQKVNFGSATLLRPLQWFDRLDPRDPLELTDGVYGLLGRYWFQNNANLWAWGLIGNSSAKGWEVCGSERWTPEFGGRAQFPVPRGEVAATYHRRSFRYGVPQPPVPAETLAVAEDRVGLDGKWDVGVGCWFEATLQRQGDGGTGGGERWQRAGVLGLDYTFGIGSGLGVMVEHMSAGASTAALGTRSGLSDDPVMSLDAQVSAAMVSYPLGPVDDLSGIVFYDWQGSDVYGYLAWQRTLDNWVLSAAAFWNPSGAAAPVAGGGAAGKGLQLTVVFNH